MFLRAGCSVRANIIYGTNQGAIGWRAADRSFRISAPAGLSSSVAPRYFDSIIGTPGKFRVLLKHDGYGVNHIRSFDPRQPREIPASVRHCSIPRIISKFSTELPP